MKSDTIGHISEIRGLDVPNLQKLGWGNIPRESPLKTIPAAQKPAAYVTKLEEISKGKDTMTGHWEIMGLNIQTPFPTYPEGYPEDLLEKLRNFLVVKSFVKRINLILGQRSLKISALVNWKLES